MRHFIYKTLSVILLITVLASFSQPRQVLADSVTASDLINLVNGIRTGTYGLPALNVDTIVMSSAQWTAQEMAKNGVCAHLASQGYPGVKERLVADGYGGGQTVWATENMACGISLTTSTIASYWSDSLHMLPMTEASYQDIGAGVAVGSNGWTYVVVQAAYVEGGSSSSSTRSSTLNTGSSAATATPDLSQYMDPVITSTPNFDGFIYHTVQYGQTLFDIALAYGVTLNYLKQENGLTSDNIYEGQTLKVMQAPTATVTPTPTSTPVYPTHTPFPSGSLQTYTPLPTITPTPQPSFVQSLPPFDRQTFGLVLVVLSIVGLITIGVVNLFLPSKSAPTPAAPVEPEPPAAVPAEKPAAPKLTKKKVEPVSESNTSSPEVKKKTPRKKKTEE